MTPTPGSSRHSWPAALADLFPTSVRTTGIALIYHIAFALFGGFAPAILTGLTRRPGGALFAPAWYVMLTAVMALIALPFQKRHAATGDAAIPQFNSAINRRVW